VRRHPLRTFAYYSASVLRAVAVVTIAVVGILLKADAGDFVPLDKWVQAIQHQAWWIVLASAGVSFGGGQVRKALGPPWVWASVESVLERFHTVAFPGEALSHEYRVTLFKHKRFVWWVWPWRSRVWPWGLGRAPWSGWLVPVARSGHTTRSTNVLFLAPDDALNAEGVAGQTWALWKRILVKDLPDLSADASDANVKDYASRARVPEWWLRYRIRKRKVCPCCLCGIPVEVNRGKWGVIILDGKAPAPIPEEGHFYKAYLDLIPFFLDQILRKV